MNLRTAGQLFGIDLAGLFSDADDEEGSNPFLDLINSYNGGGIQNINLVGSNIGANTGVIGGGVNVGQGLGGVTNPVTPPVTPPVTDPVDQPVTTPGTPDPISGPFPNFDFSDYGSSGYGMKDVYALLNQGASGADIRALGARAKDQGLNVGRRAEQLLNTSLSKDFEDKFGGFDYAAYGQPGFGMKDVDYVLKQGGSLEDIRRLSYAARDKGLNVGPRTQLLLEQEFGQRPNPEPVKTEENVQPFSDYDFASKGGKGFGMADIDYLTKAGASKSQLRGLRDRAVKEGLQIGERAGRLLQEESKRSGKDFSNFDYGAYGGKGFGMKDVEALLDQGATRKDIRRVGKRAMKKGLNVGDRAKGLFTALQADDNKNPELSAVAKAIAATAAGLVR
jgi:hypothetical protein|tara:strand:- start:1945 stop:3120 length:1176 start_codon:yes stop_codon:yes gene_type:complete